MKKIISLIGCILISTILISCNETKVLEENTKDNNDSSKYTITERNIENIAKDKTFIPLFYDSDILYGKILLSSGGEDIPYYLDKDGAFKEVEVGKFSEEEITFMKKNMGINEFGVYMIDSNKLNERKFYYYDIINKIKFELKEFEEKYSSYELELGNFTNLGSKLYGNNNYYIYQYLSIEDNKVGNKREIVIVDIEKEIYYTFENNNKNFINFYYSKHENSIMAIDNLGNIYKITLKENNIIYELYENINLNNLKIYNMFGYDIINVNNEEFILSIENNSKESMDYYNILYNVTSDEIIPIDKEKKIMGKLNDTNLYIILYEENRYLAELSENGEINLIYRLDIDGYLYMYSLVNDSDGSIFIARIKVSKEEMENPDNPIESKELKYSILEIKER